MRRDLRSIVTALVCHRRASGRYSPSYAEVTDSWQQCPIAHNCHVGEGGGIERPRPKSWGPPIDDAWWYKASDEILRRALGLGAGDGADQDMVKQLQRAFKIGFHVSESDDEGEGILRRYLGVGDRPTSEMLTLFTDTVLNQSDTAVRNRLALEKQSLFAAPPHQHSAAVAPGGGRPKAAVSVGTAAKPRATPEAGPGGASDFWQAWIDFQRWSFEKEAALRTELYQQTLNQLDPALRPQFEKDGAVQPDITRWRTRFNAAFQLAAAAKGIGVMVPDDFYHEPDAYDPRLPAGAPSNWFIGELIHAAWQWDYMTAFLRSTVLGEYMVSGAAPEGSMIRGDLRDYRELVADREEPSLLAAAAYAFGRYRPDLIDFATRGIYEIKPIRAAAAGVIQLWRYAHNFNCARYYDELTKAGARGTSRYWLEAKPMPAHTLTPYNLTEYVDQYLNSLPKGRRRASAYQLAAIRKRGERLYAYPVFLADAPGLVLYTVHSEKEGEDAEKRAKQLQGALRTVAIVVGVVALVAVLVAAIVLSGGAAAPVAAGIAEAAGVAEGAALLEGATVMAPVVDVAGTALTVGSLGEVTTAAGSSLAGLAAIGI